ncbi:Alpha/Beta hydrolase protein [Xylogone sp. PMI_703]|nr:Alpha/Beta hydrolase protein [Xylogone sp. PMI_703]
MTQIRSLILQEFQVSYSLMKLFKGPSLEEISKEIAGQVRSGSANNLDEEPEAANGITSDAGLVTSDGLHAVSKWLVRGNISPKEPRARLVMFHSMGIGASLFAPWLLDPPAGLDPIAVQLPCRENRHNEPMPTDMSELVAGIVDDDLKDMIEPQDIFWGHSFGGLVAFETLRGLRRLGKSIPRFMVTGTIAPNLIHVWQKRDVLLQVMANDASPEYMLAISRYVDNPDFVRTLMPGFKTDTPVLLNYKVDDEPPLDVPITAFAARQDDVVYPDEVESWKLQAKEFKFIEVDGDHWFLYQNRKLLRDTLEAMV